MRLGQAKRTMRLPSTRHARAIRITLLSRCSWNICEGKGPHFLPAFPRAHKIFWISLSAVASTLYCHDFCGVFFFFFFFSIVASRTACQRWEARVTLIENCVAVVYKLPGKTLTSSRQWCLHWSTRWSAFSSFSFLCGLFPPLLTGNRIFLSSSAKTALNVLTRIILVFSLRLNFWCRGSFRLSFTMHVHLNKASCCSHHVMQYFLCSRDKPY